MPYKDPIKKKAFQRAYYLKNRDRLLKQNREYIKRPDRIIIHRKHQLKYKHSKRGIETRRRYETTKYYKMLKERRLMIKKFIIAYYSDGKNCCNCCGEKQIQFLSVDHIDNDGYKHRKIIGPGRLNWWLLRNYLPDGFQILCFNCNTAKGFYGKCPHQTCGELE